MGLYLRNKTWLFILIFLDIKKYRNCFNRFSIFFAGTVF